MLKMIVKLLKVLNSEAEPSQVSLAFSFAMILGLTPLFSLHNILILLLVLILRVNLSAFILGCAFFSGLAYILDPIFHLIGLNVLMTSGLEALWSTLYQSTFWRLERFNNSIVMGSFLFSIILFIPVHLLSKKMILKYREKVLDKIRKTKVMQTLKGSRLYQLYTSSTEIGDEG